jgi:hypothetical protein
MTHSIPTDLLYFVATVAIILAAVRIVHMFRGRSMRALAARLGFQYIGPPAPPKWWWNPSHLHIGPPLPAWISKFRPSGQRIRQVWNVIEGRQNGVSLLIFDCVIGEYRGGHPCTLIVCHSEQNPFGTVGAADRLVQSHGWTVIHGVWFLWFCWTMNTQRIGRHVSGVRLPQVPGSGTWETTNPAR